METQTLGKLESVHVISPVYLQRALIIIILSFIFFLAMLIVFSLRQNVGYFLLATAFLIIQLFTLFSFMQARKKVVKLYENGFTFAKKICRYDEIKEIQNNQTSCEIIKNNGEKIVLTEIIYDLKGLAEKIIQKSGVLQNEKV